MAIREGRWDCPGCGSTGVFGRHVECPACGKPRPAGIRFYLSDDAPILVDPDRLAEARAGADWVCGHCGASNRAPLPECGGCGAPWGSSATQRVVDYASHEVPRSGATPRPLAAAAPGAATAGKSAGGGCFRIGCMGIIALMVLGNVITLLFPPVGGEDLVAAVVAEKSWMRSVAIEERHVVTREGWELPDSARLVRRERRVQRYDQVVDRYETVSRRVARTDQVPDGTETRTREVSERVRTGTRTYVCGQRSLGNGYFDDVKCTEPEYETRTRTEHYQEPRYRTETYYEKVTESEPVYRRVPVRAMHYTYRVPEWRPSRTLEERGASTEPAWPAFKLKRTEREVERTQRYEVVFRETGGERRHTMLMPQERWGRFRAGERVALGPSSGSDPIILPADSLSKCRRWHMGKGKPPPDSLGCSPAQPST
jgi:hypothetical protein